MIELNEKTVKEAKDLIEAIERKENYRINDEKAKIVKQKICNEKERIEEEFKGFKAGMGLNVLPYLASYIKFLFLDDKTIEMKELNRVMTESFLVEEFESVINQAYMFVNKGEKMNESMEKEIVFSNIAKHLYSKKENGSKKEKIKIEKENNALKNWTAEKFKNPIYYDHLNDYLDMYELVPDETGKKVMFFTGRENFELIEGVEQEEEFHDFIKQGRNNIYINGEIVDPRNYEKVVKKIGEEKAFLVFKKIKNVQEKEKMMRLTVQIEKDFFVVKKTKEKALRFDYEEVTEKENRDIEEKKERIREEKERIKETEKLNKLMKKKNKNIQIKWGKEKLIVFYLFELNGEKKTVKREFEKTENRYLLPSKKLEIEGDTKLLKYLEENYEKIKERIAMSEQNAKELFFSMMTKEQEDEFKKDQFLEIEVEDVVYMLKERELFGIGGHLLKYAKEDYLMKDIKHQCIESASGVSKYDLMAGILLALTAGDAEYIEENSNSFSIREERKKAILQYKVANFEKKIKQEKVTA